MNTIYYQKVEKKKTMFWVKERGWEGSFVLVWIFFTSHISPSANDCNC